MHKKKYMYSVPTHPTCFRHDMPFANFLAILMVGSVMVRSSVLPISTSRPRAGLTTHIFSLERISSSFSLERMPLVVMDSVFCLLLLILHTLAFFSFALYWHIFQQVTVMAVDIVTLAMSSNMSTATCRRHEHGIVYSI